MFAQFFRKEHLSRSAFALLISITLVPLAIQAAEPPAPEDGTPPQKLALLVGINRYKAVNSLQGCINDVQNMKRILTTRFDFPSEAVHVLTDGQATRQGIIEAFEGHLIKNAKPNSIVIFAFSGHGSNMADPSAPSGKISTIVPQDSRSNGVFDITADELRGLFKKLSNKTKNVTFFLDSCHSGLALKDLRSVARLVEDDERKPPVPSALAQLVTRNLAQPADDLRGGDFALLSACRANEVAFEFSDTGVPSCGTLTHFFVQEVERAPAGQLTYRDVMDQVKTEVNRRFPSQHPQLEGAEMDNMVFADTSALAEPYLLATPLGNDVQLDAGAAAGLTVGSKFNVYPPGTKTFTAHAMPIAKIEVSAVADDTATALLSEGGPVPIGARAVEWQHQFGDRRICISFQSKEPAPLLEEIRETTEGTSRTGSDEENTPPYQQIFRTVAAPTEARLIIREQGEKGDRTIAVMAGDLESLSPPVATNEPNAKEHILQQLLMWSKWINVCDIKNLSANQLKVEFTAKLVPPKGARAVLFPGSVELVTAPDDIVHVVVTNRSSQNIYFAVLDLSSDGSISVVFPMEGKNEALAVGKEWSHDIQTILPKGRKSIRDCIKLIATTSPVDFRFLGQGRIKAIGGQVDDPLVQMLNQAALMTKAVVAVPVQVVGWTTRTQVLDVVAK